MSIKDYNEVINITYGNTNEVVSLPLHDVIESNLGLYSISIRDFKILQIIKECIHNKTSCNINVGYASTLKL